MIARRIALVFLFAVSGCTSLNGETGSSCSVYSTGAQAQQPAASQSNLGNSGEASNKSVGLDPSVKYACKDLSKTEAYSLLRIC